MRKKTKEIMKKEWKKKMMRMRMLMTRQTWTLDLNTAQAAVCFLYDAIWTHISSISYRTFIRSSKR